MRSHAQAFGHLWGSGLASAIGQTSSEPHSAHRTRSRGNISSSISGWESLEITCQGCKSREHTQGVTQARDSTASGRYQVIHMGSSSAKCKLIHSRWRSNKCYNSEPIVRVTSQRHDDFVYTERQSNDHHEEEHKTVARK